MSAGFFSCCGLPFRCVVHCAVMASTTQLTTVRRTCTILCSHKQMNCCCCCTGDSQRRCCGRGQAQFTWSTFNTISFSAPRLGRSSSDTDLRRRQPISATHRLPFASIDSILQQLPCCSLFNLPTSRTVVSPNCDA